jgi:putative ABC transport system permease protein
MAISIKPSWRKVISDLVGNKVRTLLVVASIAVGVFAVGMIAGAYVIIPGDMNASYASANPANIEITTDAFDEDLITSVKRMNGVQNVQGGRSVSVRLKTALNEWTSMELVVVSDFSSESINALRHIQGSALPDNNQVIVEKRAAEKWNIQTGDVLEIELADGKSRLLPVAGIAQDLTSGIGGMLDNTKGYVTYDTLEWLHEYPYYNKLYITVKENPNDKAHIQQIADSVIAKLEDTHRKIYQSSIAEKNKHPMDSILQALIRILLILGVLIVFLSGSLISNTLSALLTQHLPQIGIMKLVGARKSQIIALYLALILAFAVIALIIAIPLGSLAAYALSDFAAGLIGFPLSGFRVIPIAVMIQIGVALAVSLVAGTPQVIRGASITVHKAINSSAAEENAARKKGLFERLSGRFRRVSRTLIVSIRNTFRRKGRLALTLFTLTLGGAIFISVFNVQVSLNNKIEQITKYFGADVNLDFNRLYSVQAIKLLVENIPGVEHIEPWAMTSAQLLREDGTAADNISLLAPPADSKLVTPILLSGRWIEETDQAAVTINEAFLKNYPDLEVGDTLRLKVGNRDARWTIVGVFQFTGVDELIAYANYSYLSNVLSQTGRTATYRIVAEDHSLDSQTQLSKVLDTYFSESGYHVNKVEAGGSFTQSITEYIAILTAFLIVMALLTALVGSIGMAGTLSMNVMERTREIGVLRAIGAYNTVVMKLVLIEGLLIGLISFVLGAALSFPITAVLADVISQAIFGTSASFAFTIQGFAIWFGVMLALSALASFIPARSASKMTIREVLSYE